MSGVNSGTTIFDIYLIQSRICAQLSLKDIRECCVVSREFYQNFAPYLYHSITVEGEVDFEKFSRPESVSALQRHYHDIHKLCLLSSNIWKYLSIFELKESMNKKIRNETEVVETYPDIVALVQSCPNLEILRLNYFPRDESAVQQFFRAIRNHGSLRELSLFYCFNISCKEFRMIFWNLVGLEKVVIHAMLQLGTLDCGNKAIIEEESFDLLYPRSPSEFKLKDLTIRGEVFFHENCSIAKMLERCTNLERLEILEKSRVSSLKDVSEAVSKLPRLGQLYLDYSDRDGRKVAGLISSCQRLTLVSLKGDVGSTEVVVKALEEKHGESLEELILLGPTFSNEIKNILYSFPNLLRLKAQVDNGPILNVETLPNHGQPWACQGLKELTLCYDSKSDVIRGVQAQILQQLWGNDDGDDDEEGDDDVGEGSNTSITIDDSPYKGVFPEVLYEQIGRLTELNVLVLKRRAASQYYFGIVERLNNREKVVRGLQEFSRLSKLHILKITGIAYILSKDDLEEIEKQWPQMHTLAIN